jgi:membrane-bound lytic murein transglycosylase F
MNNNFIKLLILILVLITGLKANTLLIEGKNSTEDSVSVMSKIKAKKQLDVIILNAPSVYYIGAQKKMGFEYDLVKAYADNLGVSLNLIVVHTIEEALQKSRAGLGDITSAGLTSTPQREKEFIFGPPYYSVEEELICNQSMHKKGTFPKNKEGMVGLNIVVGKETSYALTLQRLSEEIPGIKDPLMQEHSSDILLHMTQNMNIDCTIVNSNIFLLNQRYYPSLLKALTLSKKRNLVWLLRKEDTSLQKSLNTWIHNYERSGKMAELKDFHYAFLGKFNYYNTEMFHKRVKSRLPKYIKYFKAAGKKYNIPWEILVAQSYQESQWDPKAKSCTGVRGLMMLTKKTAKLLGVKDRLDPKESIFGGAKYLKQIEKKLPKEIKGNKDRYAFALAAYNVGIGHIRDARTLAVKLNKNPNSWIEMKEVLPLLTETKYNKNLKYGYIQGQEPVNYVSSIKRYWNIILNNYEN